MPSIIQSLLVSRRKRRLARRIVRFPPTRWLISWLIVRKGTDAALERAHEAASPLLDIGPVHRLEQRALRSRAGKKARRKTRRFVSRQLRRL
jgi:hypothetical protein